VIHLCDIVKPIVSVYTNAGILTIHFNVFLIALLVSLSCLAATNTGIKKISSRLLKFEILKI
jgi:hypothetical protein